MRCRYTYSFIKNGGGVKSRVRILFGSAKSATRNFTVGLGVPGFGYLNNNNCQILNPFSKFKPLLFYLSDFTSGYRFILPLFVPYHVYFCSRTAESLKTAYNIRCPSFESHKAVLVCNISSEIR